jgi:alanine-synthesizing transaminase
MEFQKIYPSNRTAHIAYAIRDILVVADERKADGGDLISLNIGDPVLYGFETPPHLKEAAHKAMLDNMTSYSASEGVAAARQAITDEAKSKGIDPYHVLITTGASEAIDFALSALVNRGENVLVPSPGYPLYNALLSRLIGEARPYLLDEDNNWQPDIKHMENQIDEKTKAIVIINPNNPTGSVYSREILQQVVDLAKRHNLLIMSDEIYDKLILNGREHISIASLDREAPIITFNGLSKSYLSPGVRIGWSIVSGRPDLVEDYTEAMMKLARARLCASHPMQFAIPAALRGDHTHLDIAREKLRRRRDLTVERMNSIKGLSCQEPAGAFYAFPRIEIDIDDMDFVKALIRETGVVVVHGSGFGALPATPHFRLVFLPEEDVLNRAYDRIEKFMLAHF